VSLVFLVLVVALADGLVLVVLVVLVVETLVPTPGVAPTFRGKTLL
jgi:hypothetical protein